MSSFAEDLVAGTSSWASAYIQFTTGYGREDFSCYAFVEDFPDIAFYQHVLTDAQDISFQSCGGKDGVLTLYKKLSTERRSDGNLFFVDRDTESEPFQFGDEVLRTSLYSWESHVCQLQVVRHIMQRNTMPNLTKLRADDVERNWATTIDRFKATLAKHTALLKTALTLSRSLSMYSVSVLRSAQLDSGVLVPGDDSLYWYDEKVELAVSLGATYEQIEDRINHYESGDPLSTAKGKVLVSILRKFIMDSCRSLGCTFRGEYNSARHLTALMRSDHPSLHYIRCYVQSRMLEAGV